MMTVSICGVAEVPRFISTNLTDIISIGDPAHPVLCAAQPPPDFTPFPNTRIHRFEFQDICHVAETSPTTDHIQRLLDIIDSLFQSKDDVHILFHCQAGIARSTAAAFILCVRAGMSYQQAFDYVLRVRGVLNPNLLMIKIADDLMNRGGEMLRFIVEHRWGGETDVENAREWAKVHGYIFT